MTYISITITSIRLILITTIASLITSSFAFAESPRPPSLSTVKRFAYQLQNLKVKQVVASDAQMIILDPIAADDRLTIDEVRNMQKMPDGSKRIVLAYLSIGEAEDYRDYWKKEWKQEPPSFLEKENPNWPGNFPVRYWETAWQDLILGSPDASLDRILAEGYDGIYLDIVDGFEYWETREVPDARQKMIAWVTRIATYAREKKPGFFVVPQNGSQLGENADYLKVIDAIGREDLFFDGDDRQPVEETTSGQADLARFIAVGKPVFLTEYCTTNAKKVEATKRAREAGYVPLFAPRELDALTVSPR